MRDAALAALVDAWLEPLPSDGEPCGSDLESDVTFLAMTRAAAGKGESHFGTSSPPEWPAARAMAEQLMQRTRDLRVAIVWARAVLSLGGVAALEPGLRLVHGLLAKHWERLHPMPDADAPGDYYARANALLSLPHSDGLLGDLLRSKFFADRSVGELPVRSVELAFGALEPRSNEKRPTREQLQQMIEAALGALPSLRSDIEAPLAVLAELETLLPQKFGDAKLPDFAPLRSPLNHMLALLPTASTPPPPAPPLPGPTPPGPTPPGPAPEPPPVAGLSGTVKSRADAVRAIDMACAYLEEAEPTSPAPLLLRRARKMIDQNFLQVILELAPSAVAEVAKTMGVDPATVKPSGQT